MHFLLSWVCNFFKQIYIINFKLRSNLLLLKKSFFSIQKCRGSNVNIITNHFFKKMGGTRKRKIFLPFPKWCLCVLNVISSYMKCLNIYSNHYKSLRRKNIDMCQYVVNGNDYHLNIKRVGKRENPFVSRVFCTNGKCLQASAFRLQSNKDPVVYISLKNTLKKTAVCSWFLLKIIMSIHLSVLLFRLTFNGTYFVDR